MGFQTTSILAGPLNGARSKVFFYVFQVAPEWLACAVLLSVNVREMFGTGLWGDLKKK
ncbi:hypothetical protein PHLCEN_2v610 [Hermanssonia centrifuga]|uniref:Uncharacterized protein n=1 Tax=Hermanssonia centrifuga TaxID=98765 RepID=A0A2R6S5H6_9APHY|nr:hypothetical protein PHLCEN_2v610 [Hermanssonia centrifuga]